MKSTSIYLYVVISIISSVTLGGYFLENIGIPYVSNGGPAFVKIHIYAYTIMFSFAIVTLKLGPRWFELPLGKLNSIWYVSILSLLFVVVYGFVRHGTSGMAYLINTFLSPLLLIPLLSIISKDQASKLQKLIAYLILINSIIAIIEYLLHFRVVNVEFNSFSFFRSTALLTHPLNNALITASLAILIFNRSVVPSFLYVLIILLSLFSFGGRAALVIFSVTVFLYCLPVLWRFCTTGVNGDKFKISMLLLLGYFSLLIFIFVLIDSNISDRIMSKLYIDSSASARIDVFYLFEQLSISEWIFGASDRLLESIELYIGIKVIENYIIGWIFTFGLLGMIPLTVCVFLPMFFFAINGRYSDKLAMMTFFVISLTNNSLTTKTPVLLLFLCILYLRYKECQDETKSINY
ncbi:MULTISPECIES: VpsF family polysaccharide biosynthesis protein [Vibrio]|uniref:Uncharacterized protein n=1 Tax=Vibrio genomosp. F6 str. FF-238 TaxID=1191298 RepID=A0A1E5CMS9_9VIBR|nr:MULTISPECIES: VpsF family polysaccharide biosynthesis protein [Vibrio]MDN3697937.1 VpsF family polysaccharide biosynthesis protein [Vibrio cortegadensis]OEE71105.1 hypothetical protein A130_08230 [Vibrio genomosp. F6 str. FF-238]